MCYAIRLSIQSALLVLWVSFHFTRYLFFISSDTIYFVPQDDHYKLSSPRWCFMCIIILFVFFFYFISFVYFLFFCFFGYNLFCPQDDHYKQDLVQIATRWDKVLYTVRENCSSGSASSETEIVIGFRLELIHNCDWLSTSAKGVRQSCDILPFCTKLACIYSYTVHTQDKNVLLLFVYVCQCCQFCFFKGN